MPSKLAKESTGANWRAPDGSVYECVCGISDIFHFILQHVLASCTAKPTLHISYKESYQYIGPNAPNPRGDVPPATQTPLTHSPHKSCKSLGHLGHAHKRPPEHVGFAQWLRRPRGVGLMRDESIKDFT